MRLSLSWYKVFTVDTNVIGASGTSRFGGDFGNKDRPKSNNTDNPINNK